MHCVLLGAVKQVIKLLTDSKHSKEPWYIGDQVRLINLRLSKAKPPFEVTRTPEKIDKLSVWKASEFRTFLLYYVFILEGILPEPYFSHFTNFSFAIFILLQENVLREHVLEAEIILREFVRAFKDLYGEQYLTYNLHLLTHLAKCVLNWGCLWTTSAFIPVWVNGLLQGYFNGTQAAIEQMAQTYQMFVAVRTEAIEFIKNDPVSEKDCDLLSELLQLPKISQHIKKGRHFQDIDGNISLLGKPSLRILADEEVQSLKDYQFFGSMTNPTFFPKFKLNNGSVFTTSSYIRSKKRINYIALIDDGSFLLIDSIVFFPDIECRENQAFVMGRTLGSTSSVLYTPKSGDHVFNSIEGQTARLEGTSNLKSYLIKHVKRKCVVSYISPLSNKFVVTAIPNTLETD